MTVETIIYDALKNLVGNRVFPDFAPISTARPYIVYQSIGGSAINFLNQANPGKKNMRLQINVWTETRLEAASLSIQIESAVRQISSLQPTVLGAPMTRYDPDTELRGTQQDFSVWYDA